MVRSSSIRDATSKAVVFVGVVNYVMWDDLFLQIVLINEAGYIVRWAAQYYFLQSPVRELTVESESNREKSS